MALHFVDLALHIQTQQLTLTDPADADSCPPPLALVGDYPLRVLQCNQRAAAAGIVAGQRLGTASALCETLQLCHYDPQLEQQTLSQLAAWAYGFSAQVMLVKPDLLVLEASSMLKLFGGQQSWLAELAAALRLRQLPWRWALGHTPLAATLLAQTATEATAQPNGAASSAAVLAQLLPLTLAQCQRPEASRMASMGIHTLGQLWDLPRAELGQRFGLELLLWLQRLSGQRPDPRPWFSPPAHYRRRLVLLHEIDNLTVLRFPLKRLFGELADELRRRQLALPRLQLRLLHRQRSATEITLTAAANEHRSDAWQQLCELQLQRLTLFAPIIEIELIGQQLQPQQLHSERLLAGGGPDDAALRLLAQLQARLGHDKVRSIQCHSSHRPEQANRIVAGGDGGDRRLADELAPPRPLWLLPQPQAIDVGLFTLLRGPERLESGWWQAEAMARDYFVGQRRDGALAWLYHDQHGWFVHGWF